LNLALRLASWIVVTALTAAAWPPADRPARAELSRSGLATQFGVVYTVSNDQEQKLDVYMPLPIPQPPGAPRLLRPAVMAIHGGSWIGGSKSRYRFAPQDTVIRLARAGMVVVVPDYSLARPGSPSFPTVIDELRTAVRWIRAHASELEIDPERIVVFGQSSGAHLAALLAAPDPSADAAVGHSSQVRAVIGCYGAYDLTALLNQRHLTQDPVRTLLGGSPGPETSVLENASPVTHVTPNYPPTLLIHGTADAWIPPAQSALMAEALARAKVMHQQILIPDARHGFEATVNAPTPRDLLPEIFAFLQLVWNTPL
jgi:acetyl esterase/lipase